MKRFLYGGVTALAGAIVIVVLTGSFTIKRGLVPINADAAPSSLETKIFPMILRASIARRSSTQPALEAPSEDDILAGAEIYNGMCAQCHGQVNGRPSVLGASFYPPAPQLAARPTQYSELEIFWIVKHGIRNTAMPASRNLLSDDGIRQVAAFVKRVSSPSEANAQDREAGRAQSE